MLKRRQYRKWALCFTLVLAVPVAAVMLLNYAVDPMWCFNHETPFAVWRSPDLMGIRQQKTNLLRFRDYKIDSVIMGNSRVMAISPTDVGEAYFNFGLSSFAPMECHSVMEVFYKAQGYYPKNILLGICFFAAVFKGQSDWTDEAASSMYTPSLAYRMKILTNVALGKKSLKIIIKNLNGNVKFGDIRYTSDYMEALSYYMSAEDIQTKKRESNGYYLSYQNACRNFEYYNEYKASLATLVQEPINANVEAFITPVGTPLLLLLAETPELFSAYELLLHETVDVLGGVWNFMYVNSVTSDHTLWREPGHSLPQVNKWVLDRMRNTGNPPSDFGVYVTAENIDEHLREVRAQIMALPHQKDSWAELMEEE